MARPKVHVKSRQRLATPGLTKTELSDHPCLMVWPGNKGSLPIGFQKVLGFKSSSHQSTPPIRGKLKLKVQPSSFPVSPVPAARSSSAPTWETSVTWTLISKSEDLHRSSWGSGVTCYLHPTNLPNTSIRPTPRLRESAKPSDQKAITEHESKNKYTNQVALVGIELVLTARWNQVHRPRCYTAHAKQKCVLVWASCFGSASKESRRKPTLVGFPNLETNPPVLKGQHFFHVPLRYLRRQQQSQHTHCLQRHHLRRC